MFAVLGYIVQVVAARCRLAKSANVGASLARAALLTVVSSYKFHQHLTDLHMLYESTLSVYPSTYPVPSSELRP